MALASTNVHVVEQAPQNGCCQCLCPQDELKLPPASPGGSPRSAGGSDPGFFQITASALGPGDFVWALYEWHLYFPQPSDFPKVSPTGLQSQAFWGLIFLVQDPWSGKLHVGLRPIASSREPLQL